MGSDKIAHKQEHQSQCQQMTVIVSTQEALWFVTSTLQAPTHPNNLPHPQNACWRRLLRCWGDRRVTKAQRMGQTDLTQLAMRYTYYLPACLPTYLPTYVRAYIRTYIHTYMCTCVHTYLRTYVPTYLRTYVHTYIHTYLPTYVPTYLGTYVRTYLHTYIRTYLHTYIRTYIHTYVHRYIRNHT